MLKYYQEDLLILLQKLSVACEPCLLPGLMVLWWFLQVCQEFNTTWAWELEQKGYKEMQTECKAAILKVSTFFLIISKMCEDLIGVFSISVFVFKSEHIDVKSIERHDPSR